MSDTEETIISGGNPTTSTQATAIGGDTTKRSAVISPIPDVILEAELGRGGMGVVYRGRQIYLDRVVAIKLLLVDGTSGQEYVQRFQREAKILASLAHPNIVSCYQAGVTAANSPYLVMEFIDGPTLKDWVVKHGRVPVRDALALTRDLAKALDHAHESGIIHRDVKPENVLLAPAVSTGASAAAHAAVSGVRAPASESTFPFVAKLVDLGLARPSQATGNMQLTRQGVIMGTPSTMAPEQFDDPENVDYRADIYGLGCVLYHALVGKPAFDGHTIASIITAKVSGEIPQATRAKADVPLAVNELVCALLARNRDQRPQSYREIIERCDVLLHGDAQQLGKHGNRSAWIGVAAAVVLFGGSALAWTILHPSETIAPPAPTAAAVSPAVNVAPATGSVSPGSIIPAGVARVALDKLTDADFGPAKPLWQFDQAQRLNEWSSDPHWISSEDRADAISGLSGRITRPLGTLPCRINALIHHASPPGSNLHSDSAQIGVQLVNGGRIELTLVNLGVITNATINSYKNGDDIPYYSQGPLSFPAGKPIPVTLTIRDDALIAAVDGNPLTLVTLPASPDRLCLTANLRAPAEALPIEVSGLTIRLAK